MFFKRKEQRKTRNNLLLLQSLNGREVKYVSVRDPDTYGEIIIGKYGHINVFGDELVIICGGEEVFKHPLEGLEAGEFLSLDGVNLRYYDAEKGKQYTVVAYYKYHRK